MKPTIKILILEDNQDDLNLLLHEIKKEFDVIYINTDKKDEYIYELTTFVPDIILSDYTMPNFSGTEALMCKQKLYPLIPFIIITGSINEETAVNCIKNGADDYIIKNRIERLNSAIKLALEKKKIQKEKIEAEERYKNVFENTLIGLYRTTPDGKILLANPTLLKMIGYETLEELSKRNLEEEGFEPSYPRINFKQKIEQENEIIGLESAWTRKDGTIIYVRESAKAIKDGYGNIIYYEGVVEDITEQVLFKQKLEKQYATLSSIINSPKDIIIFSLDRNYCYTSFNEKHKEEMKKVWNVDIEIGMNLLEQMTIPELREIAKNSMDRVLNGETIYEVQEQANLGIFYEFNWNPIYSDKEIIGLTCFVKDISKQKNAQNKIIQSEEKYKTIVDNTHDAIAIIQDEKIVFINKAATKMLNMTYDELIGYDAKNFFYSQNIEDAYVNYYDLIEGRKSLSTRQTYIKNSKGEKFWIYLRSIKITHNGKPAVLSFATDITDLIKSQEKIAKTENLLNSTLDNILEGCQIIAHDWTYLYINKIASEYIGKSKEEIIGKKYFEVHPEVVEQGDFVKLENSMKERKFYEEEYMHNLNNKIRYFNVRVHPVPEGLLILSKDITENKIAKREKELIENQINYIFKTANEGICLSNKDQIIKLVNPKFAQMLEYSVEELIGTPFSNLVSKNFKELFNKKYSEREEGKSDIYEIQLQKKYGTLNWFLVSASPYYDENGNIDGSFGMFTDISMWKKTYSELNKFYTGIEHSSSSVVITDVDGNIEYVNPRFTEVTGYTLEEVLGKNPRILKSGNTTLDEYKSMWNLLTSGKSWSGEFFNKKKNGDYYWEYATISPIFDEKGNITNYIGIKDDITERKKMINDLIEAKEKAEEMNKIKANFFANMSHELRTPFVGILGSAEILAESVKDPDLLTLVNAIIKSSKRLTDTLNKILSLSKIEFDEIQVVKSKFRLNETLNEIFNLFKNSYNKNLIEFKFNLHPEDVFVITDEKLLRGIIINLISNAIKFTSKGKIELYVSSFDKEGKSNLLIKVSDTGIGIPKNKHEIIFEPFRQASEGISRSFEGTGLGLTIVKKCVELLDGNIKLESEVGLGSTFTVELPAEVIKAKKQKDEKELISEIETFQKPVEPKKLLYVEDDEFSQNIIVKSLSKYYSIELVTNAKDALNKIEKNKYDALLVDVNLGYGMDGVQFVEKAIKLPHIKNIPIIAVTAYAAESDREEFLSKGFTHYISKPFSIKDLTKLVASVFYKD